MQIQKALTKQGYTVRASGKLDSETIKALKQYQLDHGWQTRIVPDSRALICLGLGPRGELLNPETAVRFQCERH